MFKPSGIKLASSVVTLLAFASSASAILPAGSLNDSIPSLVYNAQDGSLSIDTGAAYGGPTYLYNVSVSSDYGIFSPIHASYDVVWYATDYTVVTLTDYPLADGTVIGEPGFMYDRESESFLQDDLSFIFQVDPFGGFYTSDLVYDTGVAEPLQGDLDGNGFVGIDDLNIILSVWNQNVPPADPRADPSGDGFVGIDDLGTVLGNWNAGSPPSAAVPEPATAAMLVIALGAGMLHRTRK